jgi:DNA-binding MarR family transcriptional regulator
MALPEGLEMESRVTFELLQAARAYRLRSAKLLARVGLYPGQDALLKLLDERGQLTMGQAAAALSIQPPTVTKMVNRLSAAQLVKTEVMDDDRRKIAVSLTDAARDKIDEIDAIWEELEALALEAVSPQPLRSQLSAITRNLSRNGVHVPEGEESTERDLDRERMAS